jgi:hypothetical protein
VHVATGPREVAALVDQIIGERAATDAELRQLTTDPGPVG